MKLSRNVFVGSLATAGIVLGALAPSLTAQAATTSATVNADGTVTAVTPNKTVNSLNDKDNPGLAIAYDNGSGDQSAMGTATAQSDANVTVISGLLTLDKVPDFGFGTAAAGSKVDLQNNSSAIDDDGNQSGILQVTDSRTDATTKTTAGFNVTAQLGTFNHTENDVDTPATGDFLLALKPVQLTTSTAPKDVIQGQKSTAATLTSGDKTDHTVMDLAAGNYANGAIIAQFAAETGSPNSNAQLTVPAEAGNSSTASAKSYQAPITWTLTPTAMTKVAGA
ncbi:WxL domain-containing protein [Companilactobacillus keshanensis]|uniref:WxL domain-containing protein n=1 Tax=Companilactobacillus keshanensis TaxID=2486003 RepID=A0ABW4BRE7_9LACO|nr:WxL domain-containing protein [Companilactobacillus keshanensis]